MPTKISRKGPLIAIGGAEDKSAESLILQEVLRCARTETPVVGVITTASSVPQIVFDSYLEVFLRLGASEVMDIRIRQRLNADDVRYVEMIDRCDVVFISGGDQMRLTNTLGGCETLAAIRRRWEAGAVIAGTSAGAACMSTTMVYGGQSDDSLRKGAVRMSAGFGFVGGVIIDTHFLQRGRFSRLMEVGATNPEHIGVGLGEDAAVMFDDDGTIRAFGPGHVIIVDSSRITGCNVYALHEGEAVSVHNVIMHALVDGYAYSLKDRRVLMPDEPAAENSEHKIAHT